MMFTYRWPHRLLPSDKKEAEGGDHAAVKYVSFLEMTTHVSQLLSAPAAL